MLTSPPRLPACYPPSLPCCQAVLLSQLDAVRRELVEVVEQYGPHILFGKEAVREVLAFAQVRGPQLHCRGCVRLQPCPRAVAAGSRLLQTNSAVAVAQGSRNENFCPDFLQHPLVVQVAEGDEEDADCSPGLSPNHSSDSLHGGPAGEPTDVELLAAARRMRHQGGQGVSHASQAGFASEIEPEEATEEAAVDGHQAAAGAQGGYYRSAGATGRQAGTMQPSGTVEYYAAEDGGEPAAEPPAQLIPAVRRSGGPPLHRPPRYPTQQNQAQGGPAGAGKEQLGGKQHAGAAAVVTSPKR